MSKTKLACGLTLAISATLASPILADEINYVGSSTVNRFLTTAAEVYDAHTFLANTGPESSGGEVCALHGNCDMGGVAREVTSEALDQGVVATLIGRDAVAAIVNVANPVEDLSMDQLRGLFTGEITNWSDVGGLDAPVNAYIVTADSATRAVFRSIVLAGEDYAGAEVVEPYVRMISTVARDPNAIGQISFSFTFGVDVVRPVSVNGQAASVQNPDYPITRPLHIATLGEPSGAVAEFLDWALSPEGQDVMRQSFIGVR